MYIFPRVLGRGNTHAADVLIDKDEKVSVDASESY
jgi:hypothetical protein